MKYKVPFRHSVPVNRNLDKVNASKEYLESISSETRLTNVYHEYVNKRKLEDFLFIPVQDKENEKEPITKDNYLSKFGAVYQRYKDNDPSSVDLKRNRENIEDQADRVNTYIENTHDYIFVNLGMSLEMFKKGYSDEDYYWQKLRVLGLNHGGYFKNNPEFKQYTTSSTHYRHIKTLTKSLGFTTYNKVKNYRDITLQYSPIQQYIKVPRISLLSGRKKKNGDIITSKQLYKSYILAAAESYMLKSNYKAQNQGVSKFDYEKREWICERYEQPEHFQVRKEKFSKSQHDYFQGRISDSMICNLFGFNDKHSKVTIETIRKWRNIHKVNGYYLTHLFLPYKDYAFSDELIKNSYTIFYGNKETGKHKYLARVDRRIIGTVPIYTIDALKNHWSYRVHLNHYHQDNRRIIGKHKYGFDTKLKTRKYSTSNEAKTCDGLNNNSDLNKVRELKLNGYVAGKKEKCQCSSQCVTPYEGADRNLDNGSLRSPYRNLKYINITKD